jgi:hypothetical protein
MVWIEERGLKWEVIDSQFEQSWVETLGMECKVFGFGSPF